MAVGIPARDAIELYNRLVLLPFSAKAEIGQIAWRLKRTWRSGDIEAAVVYLQAVLMLGQAAEVRDVANYILDRQDLLSPRARYTFTMQLSSAGRYEDSLDCTKPLMDADLKPGLAVVDMHAALWCGDLDAAETANKNFAKSEWDIASFRATLERAGLAAHFAAHQRIVRGIVADVQCEQQPSVLMTEEGIEFQQSVFIDGDRETCRRYEDRIDDALAVYFESVGLDGAAHVPFLTTLVRDIASHWPKISNERNAA